MRKTDCILCGAICLVAALLAVVFFLFKADGESVIVKQNNKVTAEYPLNTYRRVELGHNTFIISSGAVYMCEADCKNQICVNTGRISKRGECIVCLPNRVILEIK